MAAEIARIQMRTGEETTASMRPRRMAAEISRKRPKPGTSRSSFNEAAANGRGNPANFPVIMRCVVLLQ